MTAHSHTHIAQTFPHFFQPTNVHRSLLPVYGYLVFAVGGVVAIARSVRDSFIEAGLPCGTITGGGTGTFTYEAASGVFTGQIVLDIRRRHAGTCPCDRIRRVPNP